MINIIYDDKICPDENFTCNCGHFNNKPITEFPWDKADNMYITAPTIELLDKNVQIFFKDFNFNNILFQLEKQLNTKKQKFNKVLDKYKDLYLDEQTNNS